MSTITFYCLFALTTALAAYYELIGPTITSVADLEPENNISRYPNLSKFTFTLVCLGLAPVIFPSCIIPSWGERFRSSLLNSLLEGRKI